MPTVSYRGQEIECADGAVLRDILREAGLSPHNRSALASCQGHGTCGTCAVSIDGDVEPATPEGRERWRLDFPPHSLDSGLRLSCQVRVVDDLVVEKHDGFWGQHADNNV